MPDRWDRVQDLKLEREVAIKVLRTRSAELDGISSLILELVEGQTLADHIPPGGLPLAEALSIAGQMWGLG